MIVHSSDINLQQQSSAYAMVYADAVSAHRSPPVRIASTGPVPIGQPGATTAMPATSPAIKGTAPCSISRAYGSGGGVIAQCDGQAVSVAWPAAEDQSPAVTSPGRSRSAREQARQVLLKFMEPDRAAGGQSSVFGYVLLVLSLVALCFYASTFRPRDGQ